MSNEANGADNQNQETTKMNIAPLLPGEEDFSVILNDPNFVPLDRTASIYDRNPVAEMAKADAPKGTGGPGKGTGNTNGASEKQIAFLKSLCAERPSWAEKVGYNDLTIAGLSKRAASQAIDDALLVPKESVTAPVAQSGNPATDKQIAFVRTLLAERTGNPEAEAIRNRLNEARLVAPMTAALVSECITALLEIPKTPAAEVEAGVYVLANGNLARVYLGQQSGGMLLKEVVDGDLEYRGKAERFLAGSRKATIEEVGNWGRTTGTCLVCSRRLDDPESVDRGIGPVCYARMTEAHDH